MHRLLHLQKHTHTGKKLAHRHTSYRSLFIVVALFSIFLAGFQQAAGADQLNISAKVAAQVPVQPATITPPAAPTTNSPIVTITGTCEITTPASIVSITSGGMLLGSTVCDSAGTFSIEVTLRPGENQLIAHTVNITDDYGPDGIPITINYISPTKPPTEHIADGVTPTNSAPVATPQSNIAGLKIISKYSYITYGPGKDAQWVGSFQGGAEPYTVVIDWGDGEVTNHANIGPNEQRFNHHYTSYATYFMTVTVTDKDGRSIKQQLAAVTPYIPQTGAVTTNPELIPYIDTQILTVGVYVSVAVLVGIGALGWTSVHTVATVGGIRTHAPVSKKVLHHTVRRRR